MNADVSRETPRPVPQASRGTPAIDPAWLKPREPWGYPKVVLCGPERVSREEFEAMPEAQRADDVPGPPNSTPFKVLVGGRWHISHRQTNFGMIVHYVRPMVVIVPAA
jgi:hypothetical protein